MPTLTIDDVMLNTVDRVEEGSSNHNDMDVSWVQGNSPSSSTKRWAVNGSSLLAYLVTATDNHRHKSGGVRYLCPKD